LVLLQGFVPNEGDAWGYTLDDLSLFFERALAAPPPPAGRADELPRLGTDAPEVPGPVRELIGPYLERAALLGQRTAEMHRALGGETEDPAFTPEPYAKLYQRSLYQSMRNLIGRSFQQLRRRAGQLPAAAQEQARLVLDLEKDLLGRF